MKHSSNHSMQLLPKRRAGAVRVPRKARSKLAKPNKEVRFDDQKRD